MLHTKEKINIYLLRACYIQPRNNAIKKAANFSVNGFKLSAVWGTVLEKMGSILLVIQSIMEGEQSHGKSASS
jgi:hypothetical protein